ncbi:prolyl oligopeptidase family serine peptidase [Paraburkholderia sp. BR14320]|uniref:S9 family peptidase n=1 Tax=unclassified Paraburkholderia TaxID=2615204 RepID=UPI0034CFCCB3
MIDTPILALAQPLHMLLEDHQKWNQGMIKQQTIPNESQAKPLGTIVDGCVVTAPAADVFSSPANTAEPSAPASGAATTSSSGYDRPPKPILDVMLAPSLRVPFLSPTGTRMLLVSWQKCFSIARMARPFLRLAGVRVDPGNHGRRGMAGGGIRELVLAQVPSGATRPVVLPENGCAGYPRWSADSRYFAFENVTANSVDLWIGDGDTGEVRQVSGVRLNPMLGSELRWMPDQRTLLVKLVPAHLGPPPATPSAPAGPIIQESDGRSGESSTYEARDTLKDAHDVALFDYYATSQLAVVRIRDMSVALVGSPGRYYGVHPAPDGQHLLVSTIQKPYSYLTTVARFPRDIAVWDISDQAHVVAHKIASRPLMERVPIHGVPTGPRQFSWRTTEPATLVWAEALDGGDWNVNAPQRDRLMTSTAPFDQPPREVMRLAQRYCGIDWTAQSDLALLAEYNGNRQWWSAYLINFDARIPAPRLLWDMSSHEQYADPGNPVMRTLPNGFSVIRKEGDSIFLAGAGASPHGDRPFLDRLDLATFKTQRLFRSDRSSLESFFAFTEDDSRSFLTSHQSPTDPPNVYVRRLRAAIDAPPGEATFTSSSAAVTHTTDPTPAVRQIRKRLVRYQRADGVELSFTLYTPPGYQEGTRIPAILYAYPRDYADESKAGQTSGSQETFTQLSRHRLLLLAGYAIIDNASFPIIGDPKRAYDTYIEQIVADAQAAVDEAVRLGVADPNRIGVTGHSHGALMTANLLAHSNLFRAGVATSGAYNKTLTPRGFQNERRTVWQAQDVYLKTSPFFYADRLKAPLLIVHGADDPNPGTTPQQASLLYEAIRGNGGITRLVMLPHETHGYAACESNEQLVYEMLRWFDRYLKSAPPGNATHCRVAA